jgi:LysR family nitrogen assimilation transcriptional regulator
VSSIGNIATVFCFSPSGDIYASWPGDFRRRPAPTQGIQATIAGDHYYKFCKNLLRSVEAATQEMRDFSGSIAGLIRADVMPSICRGALTSVLNRCLESYPNVELRVVEGYSGTLAKAVLSGGLDFAICNRPVSQTRLTHRRLLSDRLILISGLSKKLSPWKPCRLDEIHDLKLVLPCSHHSQRRLLDKHIAAGHIRPVRVIEMDGLAASISFVEDSDWSIALPGIAMVRDFKSSGFIFNPISYPD